MSLLSLAVFTGYSEQRSGAGVLKSSRSNEKLVTFREARVVGKWEKSVDSMISNHREDIRINIQWMRGVSLKLDKSL